MLDPVDIKVFLQTKVSNAGPFAKIGDWCLTPIHQFCGREVTIFEHGSGATEIISSGLGKQKAPIEGKSTPWLKTALMISLIVPGLIVGSIFKGIAYYKGELSEAHGLVKLHITPQPFVEVGSLKKPLTSEKQVSEKIACLYEDHLHRKVHTLIIYGNNVKLNNHIPYLKPLGVKKLILVGTRIVHDKSNIVRLDDTLALTEKWVSKRSRGMVWDANDTFIIQKHISLFDDVMENVAAALAKNPPMRAWVPWPKRYRAVYTVSV